MQKMLNMAYRFKRYFMVLLGSLCTSLLLANCVTYRIDREISGVELHDPGDHFHVGTATMGDVLLKLGAPAEILSLRNHDLFIYERALLYTNRLSLGLPLLDLALGGSADFSARGSLTRYDTLAFFFSPDGVLDHMVFEKGSSKPYLRTLFAE
jgi:hypothetical protein